ncbi:kelch-like protein 18 [Adelges cooleyi]|uniref:kelch-like protein 18 n=1 Tax=Adelges cooleyi TaxID=133065 RepID=UPI00218047F7|nr:kelch-like protein 18 [Adelges cooleyi]
MTIEVYRNRQFDNIYQYIPENILCDVTFISDDGSKIRAHKLILSSVSTVFQTMFTAAFKENKENYIHIKNIDTEVLQSIVNFAYTTKVDIKEHYVEELWMAADFYDVSLIKELCVEYIEENIDAKNCVSYMETADLVSDKLTYGFCWEFFIKNFNMIVELDIALVDLYEFPIDDVLKIIKHDDLVIDTEEKIFYFIIGWMMFNIDERYNLLPNLMKNLRLHLISEEGLQQICNIPCIRENKEIMNDLSEELDKRVGSKPISVLGRNFSTMPNIILALKECSTNFPESGFMYMDTRAPNCSLKWKSSNLSYFHPPREDSTVVISENGTMLAIGGINEEGEEVNLVDELDLKKTLKKWYFTSTLNQQRTKFAVCVHKELIYVVGGYDSVSNSYLNSVEYYDTSSMIWTELVKPMPTARCMCSVIINNNRLYVFGGSNGESLSTVEYYDFEEKRWKKLGPMPVCDKDMGVATIENEIYLIGGINRPRQVYKLNVQNFQWNGMPNTQLKTNRAISCIVTKKNDLYLFVNSNGRVFCEMYDARKKRWEWIDGYGEYVTTDIIACSVETLKSCGIYLK